MKEGKVKAVIDERFRLRRPPEAFAKLKTGRAKGKIVVDVTSGTYKKRGRSSFIPDGKSCNV